MAMTKQYPILVAGKQWGSVEVEPKGLYLHIFCRCQIQGDIMYQLMLRQSDRVEDLGVLVPEGESYVLRKRIPVKSLEQGNLSFFLKPRHLPMDSGFVPIRADTPVSCLSQLTHAIFARRGQQVGLVLEVEK